MTKYKNQKTYYDGINFDSKKEAERWAILKLLERAGKIQNLKRQVRFELLPTQYENGKVAERSAVYVADFVYEEDGKLVVEDTKGMRTTDYILKRKMMLYFNHIRITEV